MKRTLKTLLATAIALALSLPFSAAVFAQGNISIFIDGVELQMDVPPQIINDRVMVPLRVVSENFGWSAEWFEDSQGIELRQGIPNTQNFMTINMSIADPVVTFNVVDTDGAIVEDLPQRQETIDSPPVIVGDRTLVPLRFVAEAFGYSAEWDEASRTVNLIDPAQFDMTADPRPGDIVATISTSMGDIAIRLFPEHAPLAAENFTTLAERGFYDGIIFHRVINNFMIQTGCPHGTGMGGESIWGEPFDDEFSAQLTHVRGALSMANAGPRTNGSQFFIVQSPDGTPWLNGSHTVFGFVVSGMDVVDAIAASPVGFADRPVQEISIVGISVETVE